MKNVTLSGKRLAASERRFDKIVSVTGHTFELTDLEKRRQPLRDLLVEIDATHWCAWVDSWEPLSTESTTRNHVTPPRSAAPFSLQALDDLAALWVFWRSQNAGIVGMTCRAAFLAQPVR